MINNNEKEALLGYLEFHLVTLCEQIEKNLDPDAVGDMYSSAYGILNDFECTLQTQIDMGGNPNKRVDTPTKK